MALIGGVIRNANTHVALPFANACITGTFDCASTDGYGIWNALWGYEGISVTASAGGFNPKSANFTSVDIAWFPAYNSYGYWKVIELDPAPPPPPSCCFTADTEVLLMDGSTCAIASLRVGDRVVGMNGSVNTVLDVEVPVLGTRALYSLDDGGPFVTAEHPLLSDGGWRCIHPAALSAEACSLAVARLRVGDRLLRLSSVAVLAGAGSCAEPVFRSAPIRSLTATTAHPATLVYNLRLDGDHTYVANGYIAHNKGSH